ncbi:MAG: GAF domain-containing protein [Actinomycetota bacterium]|nr:GAF domain-containing protein [Actinomycetota bacterium]
MTSVFGTPMSVAPPPVPRRRSLVRVVIWAIHMALPLLGLWLLISEPRLDLIWEHPPSHFWLVAAVAAVNFVLGTRMSEAARRRSDARLFLVSLAFMSSAGFLLLHALATPNVLLSGSNAGFVIATPVGLFIAAGFVATSSLDVSGKRGSALMRRQTLARTVLVGFMIVWAALSLLDVPPLRTPLPREEARGPLALLAFAAIPLYALAAWRYYRLYRRRPAVMLLAIITAFVLLAEAMVAVALARNWHLSWWEWHVLLAAGFGFVAYSAQVEYSRERSAISLFRSISLEETLRGIREEYGAVLEALVAAMQRRVETGVEQPIRPITANLASRFDLTEGQVEVLEHAAEALASEREQILRLGGLVALGREASVILDEPELLKRATDIAGRAFRQDVIRIGLLEQGQLKFRPELETHQRGTDRIDEEQRQAAIAEALLTLEPAETRLDGQLRALILPLAVKGHPAGVLEVRRSDTPFDVRDRSLLESLASQLSIALENARLYRQIDTLFRSYMSPDVATTLLADPSQASLGGAIVEVTVLFADLRGFTPFAEQSSPEEVVTMLNRYFGIAVPIILEEGGTVVQFIGDALMAIFNAPTRQDDHALRAARAALHMQQAIQEVAAGPRWPRFRVGINTGPALLGNIGSAELRNFTAIGDTINLAARLEASADVGHVVIGAATYEEIKDLSVVHPLGRLDVKGKEEPVEAYLLLRLRE